jgi:integrase
VLISLGPCSVKSLFGVERAGLGTIGRDGRVIESTPTFHCLRHSHASALIAAG